MNRRPLAAFACCWIAGSGCSYLYDGTDFWLIWAGVALLCPLLGVFLHLQWKRLIILWLAFTLGSFYWAYNDGRNMSHIHDALSMTPEAVDGAAVRTEGTIESAVEIDGDRADFILRINRIWTENSHLPDWEKQSRSAAGEKLTVQLRLTASEELQTAALWRRGQRIKLAGTLEKPGEARNFGGFDYGRYLRHQRIHWLLAASGAASFEALPDKFGAAALLGGVDSLRIKLGQHIERLFPDWQAGYMKGLLIGLTDELDPEKYAEFSKLGLTHILAISGSHVAINVALIFGLLRICGITREISQLAVFCFIPCYVLLTGFSPSVIRSGIMTMLGVYLLRRRLLKDGMNVLAAAALLMLLWEPYFLLNVSFQLSFAVTAGLIWFVPLITPYFAWLPPKIRGTAVITLAAQIVSFPLTLYYFNQFSLLSFVANLLIAPVIGVIALPLGTAALFLSFMWLPLGRWAAMPVRLLNSATFLTTEWLSGRGGFMTYWRSPSLLWIAVFYTACHLLLRWGNRYAERFKPDPSLSADDTVPLSPAAYGISGLSQSESRTRIIEPSRRKSWLRGMLAAGLVLMIYFGYQPLNAKGSGYVQFIDVGQGDCALITTPTGANILVDGGGTVSFRKPAESWRNRKDPFEVGAKTVVPLLKKRGIHHLNAVILTHGDQDHIGGVQAVIEEFPVDAIVINGSLAESETMRKLLGTALAKHIPIYPASRGMTLRPDSGTVLDFLYPLPQDKTGNPARTVPYVKEQNHVSIVFRLTMEGAAFLFCGDMDEAAEREVLKLEEKRDRPSDINVDVIKVAHHGSRTSTSKEWLAYWNPAAALISVGENNSYGHPHPSVVKRLTERGVAIHRTDEHGEVQMKVKNGRVQMRYKLP